MKKRPMVLIFTGVLSGMAVVWNILSMATAFYLLAGLCIMVCMFCFDKGYGWIIAGMILGIIFEDNAAVCVVLASDGYPEKYDKGFEIKGLDTFKDKDGYYVFHAGTKFDGDKIVTNGGRVLGVVAKGEDLKAARANAYKATEWIDFANKYKRNDIGKAIDEA